MPEDHPSIPFQKNDSLPFLKTNSRISPVPKIQLSLFRRKCTDEYHVSEDSIGTQANFNDLSFDALPDYIKDILTKTFLDGKKIAGITIDGPLN